MAMADSASTILVPGPIIVGGGPSGLAVAASLQCLALPSTILERSTDIARLWTHRAYDRLHLHIPKHFCELPQLPFPLDYPTYPSKGQFLSYLHSYAQHFSINPILRTAVVSARFDPATSLWHVAAENGGTETVYMSRWLVVATGENAEQVVPDVKGSEVFGGSMVHTREYRNGLEYRGKRVLVVGCGNSGMEMSLDLCELGALPFISCNSGVHVLPKDMLGISTFGLIMKLLKWLPVRTVDMFLMAISRMLLGNSEKYGLKRPKIGPMELKFTMGKSPVLDNGTFELIKNGMVKIVPKVEHLTSNGAKFSDGTEMRFDSVIFATGYKNNVPLWLKDTDILNDAGLATKPLISAGGWKGKNGCYFAGFSGTGFLGVAKDAKNVALDIAAQWKKHFIE